MSQDYQNDDYEDVDAPESRSKAKGHSIDYDKKRKRAERILEQARLRELLGYDIDYDD